MKNGHPHIPEFGKKFDLRALDPDETNGYSKEEAEAEIAGLRTRINELQDILYADERYAMLVVIQGIDTAGKDSTINSVF
ncbi:MAG: polyphosphate kinase 2 family protein, partial [Dehalococcoidia bacterium]|nr:polyphosphate kinase 2 family protein [Dehalococcoidia bacterium]